MLIKTLDTKQEIVIGNVSITISKLKESAVRLGIEAPKDCKIFRKEVLDQNRKKKQNAATHA